MVTQNKNMGIFPGKGHDRSHVLPNNNQVVEHDSDSPLIVQSQDGWFILPSKTAYLLSDASCMQPLIDYANSKGLFDVVVLDPPWYNKSAKRSGMYSFLSLWQIKQLPVPKLINDNGLVFVWVTNKPKYINFTKGELFTDWGIEYLAEWHWVKVTRMGELVVDLESPHKRPYETLIIGQKKNNEIQASLASTSNFTNTSFGLPVLIKRDIDTKGSPHETRSNLEERTNNELKYYVEDLRNYNEELNTTGSPHENKISTHVEKDGQSTFKFEEKVSNPEQFIKTGTPETKFQFSSEKQDVGIPVVENKEETPISGVLPDGGKKHRKPISDHLVICSMPCQLHSRKPPLKDIISDIVGDDARCLEMFARNLTTGWTCWGNEVLKFQHMDFFDVKTST